MKKIISSLAALAIFNLAMAQVTLPDSVSLNLLNAPSNPAFNLMGISPESIDRPTDLNSFRLSIQNASNSFTRIPSNYAVEFAPAALFNIKDQTLSKFNSTKLKDVFWQSLSVSIGLSRSNVEDKETGDSTSYSKIGFGLKVSLVRPKWTSTTLQKIDTLYTLIKSGLDAYTRRAEELKNAKDREIDSLVNKITHSQLPGPVKQRKLDSLDEVRLANDVAKLKQDLKDSAVKSMYDKIADTLRKFTQGLKIERKGGFLDVAAGMALDFPGDKFDYSLVSKAGIWLTGGYEGGNHGFSFLGIGRYLFQPDKIFADDSGKLKSADISTFDAGARLLYSTQNGKFTLSSEYLYRSVLNGKQIPASSRFVFSAEYDVGFNQKITLAIGKNFDGTITKDGTLIAALNFIKGFGSTKKL